MPSIRLNVSHAAAQSAKSAMRGSPSTCTFLSARSPCNTPSSSPGRGRRITAIPLWISYRRRAAMRSSFDLSWGPTRRGRCRFWRICWWHVGRIRAGRSFVKPHARSSWTGSRTSSSAGSRRPSDFS